MTAVPAKGRAATDSTRSWDGLKRVPAILLCLGLLSACAGGGPADDQGDGGSTATPAAAELPGIAYGATIDGTLPAEVLALLTRSSQLIALSDKPPTSRAGLKRRMEGDVERFEKVLRSEGYYDGTVRGHLDSTADPIAIRIEVDSGPLYKVSGATIAYQGAPPAEGVPRAGADLGIETGRPARAQPLQQAEGTLLRQLADRGYPHARLLDRRYELDRQAKSLSAALTVETGPKRAFGPLTISGLENADETYLRRIIDWPLGETYDASRLEGMRRELGDIGLFDSVVFTPAEAADAEGRLPITLEVVERPGRSLGFSAGVSTDEIFELEAFWEHRNLFGEAERLRLAASGSLIRQEASLAFRNPNYGEIERTLVIDSAVRRENSEAFEELSTSHFIGEERLVAPNLTLTSGPAFELSRLDDFQGSETFGLVSFPVRLLYDDRDDPLDPTEGWRLQASTTPYLGVLFEPTQFWVNRVGGAGYLAVDEDKRLVFAARGAAGIIAGDSNAGVPASKRFYAGGAGSVRGFEFRTVSPLDPSNEPTGGRSLLEINLEARLRITDTVGIVPFLDGGQVYSQPLFENGGGFLWAGGLGLRYYSPIGPLRLDVAVPINGRSNVDDAFEFYLSIGQAF